MIRLGEDVFLKGRLNQHSAEICIAAFKEFKKSIAEFRVSRVVAFGTSALRDARDAEKLVARIRRLTGIKIKIIPGEEEARLIARGIMANEVGLRGRHALVDIGGGSTEVTVCNGKNILKLASFPLDYTTHCREPWCSKCWWLGRFARYVDLLLWRNYATSAAY